MKGRRQSCLRPFHQSETADDQEHTEQDNPRLRREEKGTDSYYAENQQDESDILRLLIEFKAFSLSTVISHCFTPLIFYEKG